MGLRPRGEDSFTAPAQLDPAPSGDAVRKELLEPLIAAGKDEKTSPESRIAALKAMARLSKTKTEKERAAEVVKEVLERATDEKEKSSLELLAYDLAASDGGLPKAFWNGFVKMPVEEAKEWLPRILASGQQPPDEKSVSRLAYIYVVASQEGMDRWGGITTSTEALFERLVADPEGVWRLVEAIPIAKEPEARKVERDGTKIEFTPKEFGYPSDTPVRDHLLSRLSMIQPTTSDVAKVLAKALSHEDPAIRTAAATALGNYRPDRGASNPFGSREQ